MVTPEAGRNGEILGKTSQGIGWKVAFPSTLHRNNRHERWGYRSNKREGVFERCTRVVPGSKIRGWKIDANKKLLVTYNCLLNTIV